MEFRNISERYKHMMLTVNIVRQVILGVIFAVPMFFMEGNSRIIVGSVLGGLWAITLALGLIWPPLTYKHYSYAYDDKRICVREGVVFRHRVVIPVCQIQDLHYNDGPVTRAFKLGAVEFSTAGSNFILIGLDRDTAQRLIDEVEELLRRRIEEIGNEKV